MTELTDFSKFIEAQEAQGQREFVESTLLPKRVNSPMAWEKLLSLGATRGDDFDDLFVNATLPPGWSKVATRHSMWSDLVDGRGLIRGSVFYKAAFYDRDAFFDINNNRFTVIMGSLDKNKDAFAYVIKDLGLERVVVHLSPVHFGLMGGQLGAVREDVFYFNPAGEYSQSEFTESRPWQNGQLLTKGEFFEDFHRSTPLHEVIDATKRLAEKGSEVFLSKIPLDESQWSEEFDFPEV